MSEELSSPQETGCCCHKKKERSPEEYRSLINRLNRIEGQIRGIRGMLERDAYCPDILAQAAAANAALNAFSRELLGQHLKSCVAEDIRAGREDTMDELRKKQLHLKDSIKTRKITYNYHHSDTSFLEAVISGISLP